MFRQIIVHLADVQGSWATAVVGVFFLFGILSLVQTKVAGPGRVPSDAVGV